MEVSNSQAWRSPHVAFSVGVSLCVTTPHLSRAGRVEPAEEGDGERWWDGVRRGRAG